MKDSQTQCAGVEKQKSLARWRTFPEASIPSSSPEGFTLVELLVVIAVIGILASLLMPVLGKAKNKAHGMACLSNQKQLTLAWIMYAFDNQDRLVPNHGDAETRALRLNWVNNVMTWSVTGAGAENTNLMFVTEAKLAPYAGRSTRIYKCPADQFLSSYQKAAGWTGRLRSVAMNSFLGNPTILVNQNVEEEPDFRRLFKHSEISEPSNVFVLADEHPDFINDGNFFVHPVDRGHWHDMPASYHNGAGIISFADGHAQAHAWRFGVELSRVEYVARYRRDLTEVDRSGFRFLSDKATTRK